MLWGCNGEKRMNQVCRETRLLKGPDFPNAFALEKRKQPWSGHSCRMQEVVSSEFRVQNLESLLDKPGGRQ